MAKVNNSYFLNSMRAQEKWRVEECINLLPSENASSPQVRALLSADFSNRYNLPIMKEYQGEFLENGYRGTRITHDVELKAETVAKEVFRARYACVQPLSGHVAAMIAIVSTCKRGDTIMAVSPDNGGYDGYAPEYIPDILGLRSMPLPFDASVHNVKAKEAAVLVRKTKPRLVILGASSILFPYDIKQVRDACSATGATLAYDGSHVLGLIAGGEFQKPLREGVDILYGSTHKSFFGPQGGIILTDSSEMNDAVRRNLVWRVIDNAHWNRIASLGQALLEMRKYGPQYAKQVVRNSKRLGRELKSRGFPIMFEELDYSRSHQLLYDQVALKKRYGKGVNDFSVMLEKSNLIIDSVGRLGTPEITRLGFKERDLPSLADIFMAAVKGENVMKDVKALRDRFGMEFRFQT